MQYTEFINKTLIVKKDHSGPLVLDLFAGCGGLALGFEAQGFKTIGYEMDPICCRTYSMNLNSQCIQEKLNVDSELPKASIIIGGPPCQPFSVIGNQNGLKDSRDGFPIFISAVRRLDPDLFMIENVRGLLYRSKPYFDLILSELKSLGYIIDFKVLNAVNYNVPQNRERLFIVGHRGEFSFPKPINKKVSAGEAIEDLVQTTPPDSKFLTKSMDEYIARYEKASKCINPRDLHLSSPARTLTCRNLAGATSDMHRVKLPDGRRRRILLREASRLQSFPDWFKFEGTEMQAFNQVGNAVPPMLSYYMAASIRAYLENPQRLSLEEIACKNHHNNPSQMNLIFSNEK